MAKKSKEKRIKRETYMSEDQAEIKHFIVILVILIIIIIGVYLFTRLFITKDLLGDKETTKEVTPGSINYNTTLIGSILSKPETEYYVMIFDNDAPDAVYYNGLISNYKRNTDHLKVYTADLNNELNKKFIKETENITTDLTNFAITGPILIHIKDKKIVNSYNTKEKIAEPMKYIEPVVEE